MRLVLLYATLVCASLFLDWLMMGAMHLPVRSGKQGMIGESARVLFWDGRSGTVFFEGETWNARTSNRQSLQNGDLVVIEEMASMVLSVRPSERSPDQIGLVP